MCHSREEGKGTEHRLATTKKTECKRHITAELSAAELHHAFEVAQRKSGAKMLTESNKSDAQCSDFLARLSAGIEETLEDKDIARACIGTGFDLKGESMNE